MSVEQPTNPDTARLIAVETLTFEVIPLGSAAAAIADLPPASQVSITCSPAKGMGATRDLTDQLRSAGHRVVPHLGARTVADRSEVDELARWLRDDGIEACLVISGDAETPAGVYADGLTFLRDLLDADPGVAAIGVPSYPDDHPVIPRIALDEAVLAKQELVTSAGLEVWTSTQMCFDPARIVAWAERQRARGLTIPIHLGVAGVVDRSRLLSMGMRLGVGTSLRYLAKNRRAIGRLLTSSDYDPDDLLVPLAPDLGRLGITGVHCFTFNQVAATADWRRAVLHG